MKKSKFIALAMSIATFATAMVGTLSAHALEASEMTNGYDLVYNAEKSSETTRAVDVYVVSSTPVTGMDLILTLPADETLKNTPGSDLMNDFQPSYTAGMSIFNKANGMALYSLAKSAGATGSPFSGSYVGTLIFNVADADATFNITVMSSKINSVACKDVDSLIVPAFATAPVEPEKDEVETARNDFASYADAAVTTFIAGEKAIADVASKTLTWKLTSTDGGVFEKAATVTTDLNGAGSVIFGLMIVNDDAEDFAKIDSAVLVIE